MSQTIAPTPGDLIEDQNDLLRLIQQSVSIRRHIEIFLWLNGELQRFLPHEVLFVAWGNFETPDLLFDVISPIPGVRTHLLQGGELVAFAKQLYDSWTRRGSLPFSMSGELGLAPDISGAVPAPVRALKMMRSAIVHGLNDVRGEKAFLYCSMASTPPDRPERLCNAMELIVPHLDMALRRLKHVSTNFPHEIRGGSTIKQTKAVGSESKSRFGDLGLSPRELEVMSWVSMGKTNNEIGQILSISAFTVKNHLQRVFRKLDVLNRAQAVASISKEGSRTRV